MVKYTCFDRVKHNILIKNAGPNFQHTDTESWDFRASNWPSDVLADKEEQIQVTTRAHSATSCWKCTA